MLSTNCPSAEHQVPQSLEQIVTSRDSVLKPRLLCTSRVHGDGLSVTDRQTSLETTTGAITADHVHIVFVVMT